MQIHLRFRPRSWMAMWLGLALLAGLASACQTAPVRVWRGAGHYSAGTDALVAGETARAIAELELAAGLVPAASEIQNHLGLAYLAEGRRADARAAFESAIDLDCGNQAARQNLDGLRGSPPGLGSGPVPALPIVEEEAVDHGG